MPVVFLDSLNVSDLASTFKSLPNELSEISIWHARPLTVQFRDQDISEDDGG